MTAKSILLTALSFVVLISPIAGLVWGGVQAILSDFINYFIDLQAGRYPFLLFVLDRKQYE